MDAAADDPADDRRGPQPSYQRPGPLHRSAGHRQPGDPRAVVASTRGRSSRPAPSTTWRWRSTPVPSVATRPRSCWPWPATPGCVFSIDSDAHAPGQLDFLVLGCERAEEAGIEADRIVNTWPRRAPPGVGSEVVWSPCPSLAVEVRRSKRRRRTVSAYRDGERIVVLIPASFSEDDEAEWVRTMVARIERSEARAAADRRRPAGPGPRPERPLARRPGHAGLGALGVQPERPLGLLHARGPLDPALRAAAGDARLGRRLRDRPRARAPARARPRRPLLGVGRALPAGRQGQGLPARLVGGLADHPAGGVRGVAAGSEWSVRQSVLSRRAGRGRARPARAARARGRAASSTGHHRTSSDSSLTSGTTPGGATATNRTSRWCTVSPSSARSRHAAERHGVLAQLDRHRVEAAARAGRTPRPPRGWRRRRRLASPGSQWPPNWNHRRAFACRVSSTWLSSRSSTSVLAVRWSGRQLRRSPSGCASRWAT